MCVFINIFHRNFGLENMCAIVHSDGDEKCVIDLCALYFFFVFFFALKACQIHLVEIFHLIHTKSSAKKNEAFSPANM